VEQGVQKFKVEDTTLLHFSRIYPRSGVTGNRKLYIECIEMEADSLAEHGVHELETPTFCWIADMNPPLRSGLTRFLIIIPNIPSRCC